VLLLGAEVLEEVLKDPFLARKPSQSPGKIFVGKKKKQKKNSETCLPVCLYTCLSLCLPIPGDLGKSVSLFIGRLRAYNPPFFTWPTRTALQSVRGKGGGRLP
jgi:hypothetical protein